MFWLILSIIAWGFLHLFTASLAFKNLFQRALGLGFSKFYRLLYDLFSVISITPILYLMIILPDANLYRIPSPWSYVMLIGQGISALLLLVSLLQTDVLAFAGLRQLMEADKSGKLVVNGMYRFVRHPLYAFGLLILWLSPVVSRNSFVVYLGFTLYILVGIFFEERKLLREFGQAYAEYKSATPMLIPGLKLGGNK